MTLTDKAKELFEEFCYDHAYYSSDKQECEPDHINVDGHLIRFYALPPSMQFGVYQEWADSIGYDIQIASQSFEAWFEFYVLINKEYVASRLKSRAEANQAAIDNLNRLINNQ